MAILPMISGPLSILGSSLVLYNILRDRKKKLNKTYHRIHLGFSSFDIISSFAYTLSTLPSPRNNQGSWGAIGNSNTCTVQGFFIQSGFCVVYYNSMLLFYYFIIIRYKASDSKFVKYVEPTIHMIILLMALVPSLIGAFFGLFNNVGNICALGAYPKDCEFNDNVPCERGEHAYLFLWLTSGWIVAFLSLLLPCIFVALIWNFWKKEQKMLNKYPLTSCETLPTFVEETVIGKSVVDSWKRSRSRRLNISSRFKKIRVQASYFCAAYFVCIASLLYRLIAQRTGGLFSLLCLSQFIYPLQGFLNFLNYVRPKVMRLRGDKVARTWLHGVYLTIFISDYELKQRKVQLQVLTTKRKRILCS